MKSYPHIENFITMAKANTKYFGDKLSVDLSFETFLNNWTANYNFKNMENLQILMDFQEDVRDGLYTKEESNRTYVHFKFTEAGKDFLRFKEML